MVDEAVVEEAEQVAVAERGSAEQVEVGNGQQHEPDEVVVPTLWQWLGEKVGLARGFPASCSYLKVLQGSHSSLISCSWEKLWPQYRDDQSLKSRNWIF